jgi:rod shape-determining protein MreC
MAPTPNRRPGYSRRAQYSNFFRYVAGALGAMLGALLLFLAIVSPGAFAWLRSLGSDAAAPVARPVAGARAAGHGAFDEVSAYFRAASQNAELRRELAAARTALIEGQAIAEENRRLKGLLGLAEAGERPVTYARLIASSAASTRRFATLDAGSNDGVAVGMPVRAPSGLIGRVLETGRETSRVLLVTDGESVVPVRRASDGLPGFAQGSAAGHVQIRLISLGINPLRPGDVFVTSGSGGLYRPNTPLAVVERLTRDGAVGRVLSDPATSDYVAVERAWSPAAAPGAAGSGSP